MEEKPNIIEPVVLGELKKQKSSKPVFVLFVFALTIGVTFLLPYINESIEDPASFIGKIYQRIFHKEAAQEPSYLLNQETNIAYKNYLVSNVILYGNTVSYDVKLNDEIESSEVLILDETEDYIEILNDNELLLRVKLTGKVTSEVFSNEVSFKGFEFKEEIDYLGRVKEFSGYDELELPLNNAGEGSFTCNLGNNSYKYVFKVNLLKRVEHSFKYNDISNIQKYVEVFTHYRDIRIKMNSIVPQTASTPESNTGFEFKASLDLSKVNNNNLGDFIDYNYYNLDYEAKRINYEMIAKGFECK